MMMNEKRSGAPAHILSLLLAFVLAAMTLLACVTGGVFSLMGDRAALMRAAEAGIAAQTVRAEATVWQLAEKYGFDAAPVATLVGREMAERYTGEVVDWWMGLLYDATSLEPPKFTCPEISAAVMADPAYAASVPATQQRTIAVDKVQADVERVVERTAMPLRASLIYAALSVVNKRLSLPTGVTVLRLAPVLCALTCVLLALLMLVVMAKRMVCALPYIGSGLIAGGIVTAAVLMMANGLDIVSQTAVVSTLFAQEVRAVGTELGSRIGWMAGASTLAGLGLMLAYLLTARGMTKKQ